MTRPKQQKSVSGIACEGANLAGRKTNDFLNRVLLLRCGQLEYDVIIQLLRRRNAAQIDRLPGVSLFGVCIVSPPAVQRHAGVVSR